MSSGEYVEYDPLLGWRLASNLPGNGLSSLDHGIRRNGNETGIRKGGILAAGDSFTVGSEVVDCETWPAQLERLTGLPVLNAACGGWGVDQTVMRLEQLIPVVDPCMILLGILDQDITRCNFSWGGKPKPYFLVEDGELALKHYPVPIHHRGSVAALWDEVKAMIPRIRPADPEAADFWADWARDGVTVENNPVDIACRLVHRLRTGTDIPIVMVMQHGAYVCLGNEVPPAYSQVVVDYAESIGVPVVSEFATLRAMAVNDMATFAAQHVQHQGALPYGHMSATGNATIAGLIHERLQALGLIPALTADAAD